MPTKLGSQLAEARGRRGWSLREVERRTGIKNAHLSQIESGTIERPDTAIIWELAELYELDFAALMDAAGRTVTGKGASRSLAGAALRALDELEPEQQKQALEFMARLRREQKR